MVTVRGSRESAEARLGSGRLACWCGGTLRPWGSARPRRVVTFGGVMQAQPRRAICRDCGRTHVLLDAGLLSRRKYAAAVIFAALALRETGLKVSSVAARLRLPSAGGWWSAPAATVGSWLSRFASRAGQLRQVFLTVLPLADPLARPVLPSGSVTGDALAALEAVTAGLRARFGLDALAAHEVAAHVTGGMLLSPVLSPAAGNTTLVAVAAVLPS